MNRLLRNRRRGGYVSLLAISFAFGLAVLATATAASLRAYLNASAGRERLIVDRISLESAVAWQAGLVAKGSTHPITPHAVGSLTLNGRELAVEMALPEGKLDLAMDPADTLADALKQVGLPAGLAEASGVTSLAERARIAGLGAAQEDCMRQGFTLGRWPEVLVVEAMKASQDGPERVATPGDQIDLRATVVTREGGQRVLWARVRLSGDDTATWQLHDYRRLQLPRDFTRC